MAFSRRQKQNCGPHTSIASFGDAGMDVGGTTQVDDLHVGDDATIDGDAVVTGTLTVGGVAVPLANVTGLPLNTGRAPAAWKDALGDTATGAVLGCADTPGSVLLSTAANGDTQTQSALFLFTLPPTYVSGAAITIRIRAKQATTLLTVGTTVDLVAKVVGDTLGADICTTAPQTLTTAFANYDFTVTPTSRVAGDILALDCFLILDDTGGTVNTAAHIARVEVRLAAS